MAGSGSSRGSRPARKAIRYLVAHPRKAGGHLYYWQPPTKLRELPQRPDWLRTTALGIEPRTAIAAAEKLNARLDGWRLGTGRAASGVAGMIAAYLAHSRFLRLAAATQRDYERHLDAVRRDFAGAEVHEVDPVVIDAYRERLLRDGMGERQAAYRIQVMRLLWRWGRGTGWVTGAVPIVGTGIRTKRRRVTPWDLADLRAIVAAEPYPIGLAVRLGLYTMQREGDLLRIGRDDLSGNVLHVVQGKTATELFLPVHPWLMAALDAAPERGATFLATRHGEPYTETGFRAMWRRVRDTTIPAERRRRFHDVRATGISRLRGAGLPDEDVILWSGHRRHGSGAVVDRYDARLGDMAAQAFPTMDGWEV